MVATQWKNSRGANKICHRTRKCMGHEKKISFLSHGAKFLFILSLEQWRKIELVQFCCIAPGTNLSVFWVFPSFFPLFLLHEKRKNTMGHGFFSASLCNGACCIAQTWKKLSCRPSFKANGLYLSFCIRNYAYNFFICYANK